MMYDSIDLTMLVFAITAGIACVILSVGILLMCLGLGGII